MPALPESASNEVPHGTAAERLLVVSLSWLGDCVMAMPALAALRCRQPGARITVLAKPAVAPLWRLFGGVDEVIVLKRGWSGTRESVQEVRTAGFDFAYILPKSFRAAWIPFLARVPGRRGMPGHGRDWMLTETARLSAEAVAGHQSLEIADVLQVPHTALAEPPFLTVPADGSAEARAWLVRRWGGAGGSVVAFFPGAAYGPAKRWPVRHFIEAGRRLVADAGAHILVLGSDGDRAICAEVAAGIGAAAVNRAGETNFGELVALLSCCRAVLANDSGGMHLAAGLGVPVVGIFGLTDPVKTAPVGCRAHWLAAEGVRHTRDVPRDSAAARAAMESIPVVRVVSALMGCGLT